MSNFYDLIKASAGQAYDSLNPSGLYFGEVASVEPLQVRVEQKLLLEAADLLLSTLVQDFVVEMTVAHQTENDAHLNTQHSHPDAGSASFDSTHHHAYQGTKSFTVHLGLAVGEKVMLLRQQGGQKYLVLDRVR